MKYIDVIVPLPLDNTFTYIVPDEWVNQVSIGMRVVVPFGKNKMHTAIVCLIHSNKPELYEAKEIICLLDPYPILRHPQLKFWNWMSSYYQSYIGEVYQAAIPSGLKLESETLVRVRPDFDGEITLTANEQKIIDVLADGHTHTISDLTKLTGIKTSMPILKRLMEQDLIEVSEELNEKYRPKIFRF